MMLAPISERLLTMLKNDFMTDIVFVVQGEEIRCHKLILSSCKNGLKDLVAENCTRVDIDDVAPNTFKAVLKYLYANDCKVNNSNIFELMHVAQKFALDELDQLCGEFLQEQLTEVNLTFFISQALQFGSNNSLEVCLNVFRINTLQAVSSDHFPQISHEALLILCQNKGPDCSDARFFGACMEWAKAECERQKREQIPKNWRYVLGDELLSLIQYRRMSLNEFMNVVVPTKLLTHEEVGQHIEEIQGQMTQAMEGETKHTFGKGATGVTFMASSCTKEGDAVRQECLQLQKKKTVTTGSRNEPRSIGKLGNFKNQSSYSYPPIGPSPLPPPPPGMAAGGYSAYNVNQSPSGINAAPPCGYGYGNYDSYGAPTPSPYGYGRAHEDAQSGYGPLQGGPQGYGGSYDSQWQCEHNETYEAYPQDSNVVEEKAYKQKEYQTPWMENTAGNFLELPKHWASMNKSERYKWVVLQACDDEYQAVEMAFHQTVPNLRIVKIERIQNPTLWRRYAVHKQLMTKPNEQNLWYGTSDQVMPYIVANGFNRSYCDVHGVPFGMGIYLAQHASTAVGYMSGRLRLMFQVKVLVGQCVRGNQSMREPPFIPGTTTNERYDTTGDATGTNPSVAVVYHDTQCYPAYLLTIQ